MRTFDKRAGVRIMRGVIEVTYPGWTPVMPPAPSVTVVDAGSVALDLSAANVFKWTLGGDRTLANPTNVSAGTYIIRIKMDETGGRSLSFGSNFRFPSGIAPLLSEEPNAENILTFVSFGGTELYLVPTIDFQAP